MLTFNQIYSESQEQCGDQSAESLGVIKRGINQGMKKFGALLSREWRKKELLFSTSANNQYYQMPENAIRVSDIEITNGGTKYHLEEIADGDQWRSLNSRVETSNMPQFFHVKGSDQFGVWPTPAANGASNGLLTYEAAMRDMTAADYSTGTIALATGTNTVTGSSTVFTPAMVGRTLIVDPAGGNGDGAGYKIQAYVDATHVTLENYYGGMTVAASSFIIGEVPDIPEEFHESLIDYAMYRFYMRRKDVQTARVMKAAFDESLVICQQYYSSSSTSQYTRARRPISGFRNNNKTAFVA